MALSSDYSDGYSEGTSIMDLKSTRGARKESEALVDWVRSQFKQIKNARTVVEQQWYLNLAFYFGKQNVYLARPGINNAGINTTRLWVPSAPYYRSRPVINRVRPTIRTELAQLTGNRPNATVVPASSEDRDMYAAMAAEQIWYNQYVDKKLKHVIRRAMWWTLVCGNGFIKTYWDPSQGPNEEVKVMDPETGQPMTMKGPPIGDIVYQPETPFHVLCPDFREEELENQPFLLHAQTKSPDWVKMRFPDFDDKKGILKTGSGDPHSVLEDTFLNLVGTQTIEKYNSVIVLECWIKPGMLPRYPQGAIFTVVGDQIVQAFEGWPYQHGKYPFAKFDHIPGGKFYSSSNIEDIIPIQKEYNRTRGQITEAKNRMAKPQLAAAKGSIDPKKITSEPGLVILYTPGMEPPTPIPLQGLPNYVLEELDRMLTDWADIVGQHEVTRGQVPPGVTAATAISYLQERDESKLAHTFDSLEEGIEKTAQMALSYVQEFWDQERTVRVTGPDGSFDALAFKGSDLRNNIDIRIEGGSALPNSKAAKQALIMDLMKFGFVEPNKGLELMDMGGINKLYEQLQTDQRQVQRENLRMSKVTPEIFMKYKMQNDQILQQNPQHFGTSVDPETGQEVPLQPPLIIPTNTYDNHALHVEYHNQFRKGQAFEQLSEENKILFEMHVREHIEAMGVETESMNPRKAAGLPPLSPEEQEAEQEEGEEKDQEGTPGPTPVPESSLGEF